MLRQPANHRTRISGKVLCVILTVAVTISVVINFAAFYLKPERAVQLIDYFNLPPVYLSQFDCHSCNNYSGTFVANNDNVCAADLDFLVLVTSTGSNRRRRDAIRASWGSAEEQTKHRAAVVFVLGVPSFRATQYTELYQRELEGHNDIVIVDIPDSYKYLTRKTFMLFQWVTKHCPGAKYIMKTDDDSFNVLANILDYVRHQNPDSALLAGQCASGITPYRDPRDKWYVSESEYPGSFYPLYVRGRGYIMTQATVHKLLAEASSTKYNPMEDVFWTGMCRQKAGIRVTCSEGFATTQDYEDTSKCTVTVSKLLNIHHVSERQMGLYWEWYKSKDHSEELDDCKTSDSSSICGWPILIICCVFIVGVLYQIRKTTAVRTCINTKHQI